MNQPGTSSHLGHQPAHQAPTQREEVDWTPYVDARLQAVQRLYRMSLRFGFHAWEHRFDEPLCPHSLAYLYRQPDPHRESRWLLMASWMMWLDRPETRQLPHLLFELHHRFARHAAGPGFDIRDELSVGRDKDMAGGPGAVYTGLGVISLDTRTQTWEQVKQTASSEWDVSAVIRIVLNDGAIIVGERYGRSAFDKFTVQSTQPLAYGTARPLFDWTLVPLDTLQGSDEHGEVLRWAAELSDTLSQADNGRICALKDAATTGAGPSTARR